MPTEISGSTGVNKIQDGTVVNADINSSAEIVGSKLKEISFGGTMTANQNISTGSFTKISIDSELWDTATAYDNSTNYRFTVPTGGAGRYSVHAGMEITGINGDKFAQISIRKNGSSLPGSTHRDISPYSSPNLKVTMSSLINCSDGDYLEMWVYHNTGETESIAAHETFFGAFRI